MSRRKPRIIFEFFPNPDAVGVHCTSIMSRTWESVDKTDFYAGEFSSMPARTKRLLEKVFRIAGIKKVYVEPYELTVHKASAFEWKDVLNPLRAVILKTQFKVSPDRVVVVEKNTVAARW